MSDVCGNCQWWANLHPSAGAGECSVQGIGVQKLRPLKFAEQASCAKFKTSQACIRAIKARAQDRCEGCRLSWRLKGWMHSEPMPIECDAKAERQKLRDIECPASVGNVRD